MSNHSEVGFQTQHSCSAGLDTALFAGWTFNAMEILSMCQKRKLMKKKVYCLLSGLFFDGPVSLLAIILEPLCESNVLMLNLRHINHQTFIKRPTEHHPLPDLHLLHCCCAIHIKLIDWLWVTVMTVMGMNIIKQAPVVLVSFQGIFNGIVTDFSNCHAKRYPCKEYSSVWISVCLQGFWENQGFKMIRKSILTEHEQFFI